MKTALVIVSILISFLSSGPAQAQGAECFQKEIDPQTKRFYQNRAQWDADRKKLWSNAPAMPSLWRLKRGYDVSVAESKNSRGMGSDKRRHCYVGCRIANDVGHDVAVYAGYYKEDKDLVDCDPGTHFDHKDIEATVRGADIAAKAPGQGDAEFCKSQCQRVFKK